MNYLIFCVGFAVLAMLLAIIFFVWNRALEQRDKVLFPTIELFISVFVGLVYSLIFVWLSTDWTYLARIVAGATLGIFGGWALIMTAGFLQTAILEANHFARNLRARLRRRT